MAAEHVPGGVRASWLVADADTAEVLRRHEERHRFRSASLVKPIIALDHLRRGGEPSAADRALLEPMLRSSDDDAASELWDRGGRELIVHRTVAAIGLTGTEPPRDPDMWGYVVLTPVDVALVLRHLRTAGSAGEFVLEQLRRFTRHGTDGFDQTFGLPAAGAEVDALKQGWSGFGLGPNETPPEPAAERRRTPDERVDLEHPAMHTSGLVRCGDRLLVVAVCTLHPAGTGWDTAAETITELTRSILD